MESDLCKIRDALRAINDFEVAFHARHGIGLNEGMLLCTIAGEKECCSSDVADKLGLSASNASKVLASAEKKGLVKRALCSADKRRMLFVLTTTGKQLLTSVKGDAEGISDVMEKLKSL
ncbi:MarR family winged helix-turn-helix transcriptional regulator [Alistipes indistinctus]|uniref:MarR family winged helix-turn-helix transcriptional regulator n=1 Tax=Alistipes indistinctus TaxID=626932 RepID=UPI003AB87420